MSHQHTPVTASVIKSTSRFAPKAVPRKQQSTNVPPPKQTPAPTLEDEASDSGDEFEEDTRIDSLDDITLPIRIFPSYHWKFFDNIVGKRTDGVPTIQSSVPS